MEQVYTDGKTCKSKIIESISSASDTIRIAMAYFTDREIANEITKRRRDGVDVSVILSNDFNNENVKTILSLECKVYIHVANGRGLMHHKFCIIDSALLLHGSYNYTYNALTNNEESLNLTDSAHLISQYDRIFEDLLVNQQNNPKMENNKMPFQPKDDATYLEKFTDELKNHISQIFDDFDQEDLAKSGNNLAKTSDGSEAVFVNYLDSALAEVNTKLNQSDHTKVLVKTRMSSSLDRAIETNVIDLESDLSLLSSYSDNQKSQLQTQVDSLREKKLAKQSELNDESSILAKVKASASEVEDEVDSIDRQIVVRNFWVFPTFFKLFLAALFLAYLSIFFSSAIWKIFFERNEIMKLLARGVTPEAAPLFDANAIVKIYTKKGQLFGSIAALFFIVPVMLTSIKLLVPGNKLIEYLIGWVVGIFVIDIVVSVLISQHTFEINQLATGGKATWTLLYALQSGEFWLIFIFGALPVFITKFLIESIWTSYNNSSPELVDRERFLKRNSLKRKLSELAQEGEVVKTRMEVLHDGMKEIVDSFIKRDTVREEIDSYKNNKSHELKERSEKRNKNLREIYNSFIASVDSGNKLFLQNVVGGRITAFKQGFFLHLTSYFSQGEAAKRIDKIETSHKAWLNQQFK